MKSISNKNFTQGLVEGWINAKIFLASSTTPITGVMGLKYTETNNKEAVYGIGNQPIGFSISNYEYDGEITLLLSEVQALQLVAVAQGDSAGSITSILPFEIFIIIDKIGSTSIQKNILNNCVFQSNGIELSQGEGVITVTIPIMFSSIQWV